MPFHNFPHSIHWKHSLKTALAAGVTLFVTRRLHLPEPHWACLSTVLVMQSEHGATARESRDRFLGTAVGALLGFLAATLGDHLSPQSLLLYTATIWIGMLLTGALDLHGAGRFAGVAATIVFLLPSSLPPGTIAFRRFSEVTLGILVAYLISRLLWPQTTARVETC